MEFMMHFNFLAARTRGAVLATVLAVAMAGSTASARPALNEEQHINDSLVSAAVGELIRRKCSTISVNYFVALGKAHALKRYALGLGYSRPEIEAFLEDKDEQKRVRRSANSYLKTNGVVKGNEATYCTLGRTEIANRSLTGQLIWAR